MGTKFWITNPLPSLSLPFEIGFTEKKQTNKPNFKLIKIGNEYIVREMKFLLMLISLNGPEEGQYLKLVDFTKIAYQKKEYIVFSR